ncbi:hypothetical protein RJ640_003449 [Escallonia rubra]|uniref:GAG-pre-integrase domain-containing protein n=1 Tax=Escallonia rubra TaxID=112253 RepID=A0AA88QJ26_9ASTE|nr:hypothetical protein RJ640_003449 [Escallonia rubra]
MLESDMVDHVSSVWFVNLAFNGLLIFADLKAVTNQQKNWCRSAGEKLLRWSSRAARRRETAAVSAGAEAGATGFRRQRDSRYGKGDAAAQMQVEDYLYQKDLYLPLVGEKHEAMSANEWAILDRKALATVRLSLTPQVAFNISMEKTTAAVMKALKKFQLESVGINFDDEIRALLFLCSLPDSWNSLVTTMSNSTISGTLTLNDVLSSMKNDEMRRKTIGDGISSSTALSVESKELEKNLISVNGMDREGYFVAFGGKTMEDDQMVDGGSKRLGHSSESGMRILHSKNAFPGMKNIQLDFFEGCVYGKQKLVSFRRDGKAKKTERLELVHTDVCGPTIVKSIGSTQVFTSVNDCVIC